MAMFYLLDETSGIHIPTTKPGEIWGRADGLGFEIFHEQVSYHRADRRTHDCTMVLFEILTLQEEVGIFETNLQQCNDVLDGHRGPVVQFGILL